MRLDIANVLDSLDFFQREKEYPFPTWSYGMYIIQLSPFSDFYIYNRFYDGYGKLTRYSFETLLDYMSPEHQEEMMFHLDLFV